MDHPPHNADERKIATIMFVDIVDSSLLVDELEPDASLDVFRPAMMGMSQSITTFGGTVNRVTGDGIMALFGAPAAHEDHALAACAAAVDIIRQLGISQPGLPIRIGIHSGEFVVHSLQLGQISAIDAVGAVAHIAARLQQGADPGTIWISQQTHDLCTGRLRTEDLGEKTMRGFARPIGVHRLLDADHRRARFDTEAGALSPLVGRAGEMAALLRAAAAARQGRGATMLLSGEAGIGKTRLLHELRRGVGAWAGLIDARAVRWRERSGFHVLRQLVRALAPAGLPMPGLAEAAAVAIDAMRGEAEPAPWRAMQPSQRRQAMLDAFVALVLLRAGIAPVILIVDDVHWLDEDSAEALASLMPRLATLPVLLLLASRLAEPPAGLAGGALIPLPLPPLDRDAAASLARHNLPGAAETPATRVAQICARCDGNPLFIEQASLAGDPDRLPADIRVILGARIDALPPPAKRLLETIAALEEPSPLGHVAACVADWLSEEELAVALAHLAREGFITRSAHALLACRHALFQEVAYRTLTERRRLDLHARIAGAIEGLLDGQRPADHAELLARHSRLGGLWAANLRHAGVAARHALARFANRAAAGFIEEAIHAADQLPREPALLGTMIDLRLLLREPLFRLGQSGRILARLDEAEALAVALGDRARLAQLRIFRSHHAWMLGRQDDALAAIEEARAQAAAEGDAALALRAHFQWGMWAMVAGRLEDCAAAMAEVAAGADDPAHGGRYGLDAALVVVARGYEARVLVDLGDIKRARAAADACVAKAELVARPFSWTFAAFADGYALHGEGEAEAAIARLAEGLAHCDRAETDLMRVVGLMLLGVVENAAGRFEAAVAHLSEAVGMAAAMPFMPMQPARLAWLGQALAGLGRTEEAQARQAEALALARDCGDGVLARLAIGAAIARPIPG